MGMFDTVYADLSCPSCAKVRRVGVQFKFYTHNGQGWEPQCAIAQSGGALDRGPFPSDIPKVRLSGIWTCYNCVELDVEGKETAVLMQRFHDVSVHIDDGIVTVHPDETLEEEYYDLAVGSSTPDGVVWATRRISLKDP